MFPNTHTQTNRSQAILEQIISEIELIEKPIFMNNFIHFQYRFKDESHTRELIINSPLEFAAFCFHQNLIDFYDVDEDGVHLYQRVINSKINRYSYPVSKPGYLEVERLKTGFTQEEIIKMIAIREHDFGTRSYEYKGKRGIVIPLNFNPTSTTNAA